MFHHVGVQTLESYKKGELSLGFHFFLVCGTPDDKGEPGNKGSDGLDLNMTSNWKQCAWKLDDGKDNGLVQVSLNFTNSESYF